MQNSKRYWLRGGLSLAVIFLVIAISWWVYISINIGCVFEPIQMVNMGGGDCIYNDYQTIIVWSLIYFGIPTLFGFVSGTIFSGIFGLVKRLKTR
jgi:hypothetical protein